MSLVRMFKGVASHFQRPFELRDAARVNMELTIKIEDRAKAELLREVYRQFRLSDGVDVSVDLSTGSILVRPANGDAGSIPMADLVQQAFLQEETFPMTDEDAAALERELADYAARKADALGLETDDDVYLILSEHKNEQRTRLATNSIPILHPADFLHLLGE